MDIISLLQKENKPKLSKATHHFWVPDFWLPFGLVFRAAGFSESHRSRVLQRSSTYKKQNTNILSFLLRRPKNYEKLALKVQKNFRIR